MRTLAVCLLGTVLCHAQESPAFRTGVSLVHVDAEVTDGTGPLSGFHKEDFLITDNRVPQHILYFSQDVEPLDLILLFDISGSMRPKIEKVAILGSMRPKIEKVAASSRKALAELRAGDRVAV